MSGQVRIHNQDVKPQIVVPNRAVVEQMGEYFIYVAKDSLVNDPKAGADSATKKKKILMAEQKKDTGWTGSRAQYCYKSGIDTTGARSC